MEHLGRWLFVFAVERDNGQASFLVLTAVHLGTSIGGTTETMFGCIDFSHVDAQRKQGVHQMRFANDTRLVADDAHAFAFDIGHIVFRAHGGTDVMRLVDEGQIRFVVCLEYLGLSRCHDNEAEEGYGKELLFHFRKVLFCKSMEKSAKFAPNDFT